MEAPGGSPDSVTFKRRDEDLAVEHPEALQRAVVVLLQLSADVLQQGPGAAGAVGNRHGHANVLAQGWHLIDGQGHLQGGGRSPWRGRGLRCESL